MLAGLATLGVLAAAVHLAISPSGGAEPRSGVSRPGPVETGKVHTKHPRPNIVMVLMDDASYELLATMPQARRMQATGATYVNSHVVDSLCCPSRAAIFTGRPPHQTGVLTNTAIGAHPIGGYEAYRQHGDEAQAFNLALQKSGYTTGFIGKYLNGYESVVEDGHRAPPPEVPGWNYFSAIVNGGYPEWDFWTAREDNGGPMRLEHDPAPARDSSVEELDKHYATNVMSERAVDFVKDHREDTKPYFLEVATYATHAQISKAYPDNPKFPPAFADRPDKGDPSGGNCGAKSCADLSLNDFLGYGDPRNDNAPTYLHRNGSTSPAPPWNVNPVTLTDQKALRQYRDRARMVQAVDRLVGRIRAAVGTNTYVMLTSDNGYHLGQLQLNGGKGTPYDFDTRVPLVVDGPRVRPGPRQQFVSNIDLAPTFERLAGVQPPGYVSGLSFARSLHHPRAHGRKYAFFDHTYGRSEPGEVDDDSGAKNLEQIPSYIGVRGKQGLLVRDDLDDTWKGHRYAWELYRYDSGFFERTNVFASDHEQPWARDLMRRLKLWDDCDPAQCREAAS